MKLKVCGMNQNPSEVAQLQPDYLGFIFWEPSTRYFEGEMPTLPASIKKVGVFVDASIEEVLSSIEKYGLAAVQLHGNESPKFCKTLKKNNQSIDIIKVFSIKDDFDFSILEEYEEVCDYYLFDTKGKLPGGNGYAFDWSVLNNYLSTKPYFLSGGIGLDSASKLQAFLDSTASRYCHVIDVNSKFEMEPGLKNIDQLREFKKILTQDTL
ncbi:phosphoribosylanthranilate isomerase [Flagellimonas sp. S3867]|uniref:phosphoribosylanthranilate isomerase n=1 Tax=Flagellimonas sp. S3867 TaxID=2768063 RepID=UPI0016875453|nr:phosphoribosylanthranilate isomerase [Flagellimonas sp. S3867]